MRTHDDLAVAAGHSVDPARWLGLLDELMLRVGPRFRRVEPRRRARAFVLGLLAALPRKNCWTIAEHAGDATPDGMQHLLARARWDADGVRDDLRGYVIEHLGDPDAVLVADETGDLKKGTATVGVQRQYTGTAGRIENAQVAVYLGYASAAGHALIDRELYLPRSWTGDPARCQAAGIPRGHRFATKPAAGAADDRAGPRRRRAVRLGRRRRGLRRTTARCAPGGRVARSATCWPCPATTGCPPAPGASSALTSSPPACPGAAWQRLSAGEGAKGTATTTGPGSPSAAAARDRWLLIRRNRRTGELAFYRCYAPRPSPSPRW